MRTSAALGLLAVLTVAVFLPLGGHDFINLDDDKYIYENRVVSRGLTVEGLKWAFSMDRETANWHPLTWVSHMIDVELLGLDPGAHHLFGLLLHTLNVLLLFGVLRSMTAAFWPSFCVAALFAVHPLHVESVAWAAERKDLLSAAFWFLAMAAYASYCAAPTAGRYLRGLLLFALGLRAKPMVITLPFVLLLLDFWPLGKLRGRGDLIGLVVEKIPFFLLSAASGVVTYTAQKAGGAVPSFEILPMGARLSNTLVSYLRYLAKTLWPQSLGIYYPHDVAATPTLLSIAAVVLLAAISVAAWSARKNWPFLLFGWLWYLGTLVPVLGIVQVGGQAMADRYTYLPLTGLFVIGAWGVEALLRAGGRSKLLAAGTALCLVATLGLLCRRQVGYWRDSVTLYERTLETAGPSASILNNIGIVYLEQGRTDEAVEALRQAFRLSPLDPDAIMNLGVALADQGKAEEALPVPDGHGTGSP